MILVISNARVPKQKVVVQYDMNSRIEWTEGLNGVIDSKETLVLRIFVFFSLTNIVVKREINIFCVDLLINSLYCSNNSERFCTV
jgi:hypothetical protein